MRNRYYVLTLIIFLLAACGGGAAGVSGDPGPVLGEATAPTDIALLKNNSELSGSAGLGVTACPSASTSDSAAYATEVLRLVNAQRTKSKLTALTANNALTSAAQAHAMDMACGLFLSHTGSDGSNPFDRMLRFGYSYSLAAENVAAGYPSPSDVVKGWMGSAGHRANIMNASFTEAGIGYVYNSSST